MDQSDTISLIVHGCRLAKNLELNLSNIANQPELLSNSCEEIMKIFADAIDRLNVGLLVESNLQDRFRSSCTEAMKMVQAAKGLASKNVFPMQSTAKVAPGLEVQELGSNIASNAGSMAGKKEVLSSNISDPCKGASSSSQRKQRRNEEVEKSVERVPAPMMGNTDIPPEDGHTWRKYGQKEILGSRFPRAYYRCTHQNSYQCPAKKQVQRIDDDPYMFNVTYLGNHTCHMSSTAPTGPAIEVTQEMSHPMTLQPITTSFSRWLPAEFSQGGGASSSAGPSTTQNVRELEYPVANMADVMFNFGSSSSNSIDFIFQAIEEQIDPTKKKK